MNRHGVLFRGVVASPGLAAGTAYLYEDVFDRDREAASPVAKGGQKELDRLKSALQRVREDLLKSAKQIEKEAQGDACEIFVAHEMILSDPGLEKELETMLESESMQAESVVQSVFRKREERFLKLSNPTFRHRADDVADIARRVLRELAGIRSHVLEKLPAGSVLVTRNLYASEMVYLTHRRPEAIAMETGAPGSHMALLAQAIGIPAVTQLHGLVSSVTKGDLILVDGLRGTVVVNPDERADKSFRKGQEEFRCRITGARQRCKEPAVTTGGLEIPVMANVNLQGDAERASDNGADGIGLYRVEGLYLERKDFPDEHELAAEIGRKITPLADKPICLRLLDIGGDKQLPYLDLPKEMNPFLGTRGIRLLFDRPELLRTQLRAFLQLSRERDIRILVPMITMADEMKEVRELAEIEAASLGIGTLPMIGAMIETPAAALCVPEIVEHADFLSIGTNDLTQYVMAADRDSPPVSRYFQDDHPAVLRLIRIIAAEAGGKLVAVCGKLAGKEEAVPLLIDAGVRLLSVSAPLIPIIKDAVRNSDSDPGE